MEDGLTKLFIKCAKLSFMDITKKFVLPNVAIGAGVGAGIGALTSSNKDAQGNGSGKVGGAMKGLALGAAGDVVTGYGQGMLENAGGLGAVAGKVWTAAKGFLGGLAKTAELEQKLIPIVSNLKEFTKVAVSEKLVNSALEGVAEKLKLAKTRNERFPLHIQNIIFNKYKREKFPVPHKMKWFI